MRRRCRRNPLRPKQPRPRQLARPPRGPTVYHAPRCPAGLTPATARRGAGSRWRGPIVRVRDRSFSHWGVSLGPIARQTQRPTPGRKARCPLRGFREARAGEGRGREPVTAPYAPWVRSWPPDDDDLPRSCSFRNVRALTASLRNLGYLWGQTSGPRLLGSGRCSSKSLSARSRPNFRMDLCGRSDGNSPAACGG
jgi:hypothetical protein